MSQCVQVTPSLTAERTFGHDPTVWNGFDRGGDGLAASLAPNGEVAETGLGQVPHNSIGEYKTKICTAGIQTPMIIGSLRTAATGLSRLA